MIITICILLLLALFLYLTNKSFNSDKMVFNFLGPLSFIMAIGFSIYLIIHIIGISMAKIDYEQFLVKRNAFIETIDKARKNPNFIENTNLTEKVAEFNVTLAIKKHDNKIFLFKDYIDDRFEKLEPIK